MPPSVQGVERGVAVTLAGTQRVESGVGNAADLELKLFLQAQGNWGNWMACATLRLCGCTAAFSCTNSRGCCPCRRVRGDCAVRARRVQVGLSAATPPPTPSSRTFGTRRRLSSATLRPQRMLTSSCCRVAAWLARVVLMPARLSAVSPTSVAVGHMAQAWPTPHRSGW